MRANKSLTGLVLSLLALSLVVAQGGNRSQLSDSRTVALPAFAVLDETASPVLSSSGKVGFISSVTGGSLISFSLTSGKIISSVAVGETVGAISMVETGGRRLIAVPAANHPDSDHPATVSIIDATNARQMELQAIPVLPAGVHITPSTRPLLTGDGRYCVIASSFNEPTLFAFNVATGEIVSQLMLPGRPSEVALYEGEGRRLVAVASAAANVLSMIRLTEDGGLGLASSFSPVGALDHANNPAFSGDGRYVYIAAAQGDALFAVEADSGAQVEKLPASHPGRITVARGPEGDEIIGVTRLGRPSDGEPGGVTIMTRRDARVTVKSEFTPPEQIEIARANNVEFDADALLGFVGSATGILFAFDAASGELEAYQDIGRELRRVAVNAKARTIAAVRSGPAGDGIAVLSFDLAPPDAPEQPGPVIRSVEPASVEQGRLKSLDIAVAGDGFGEGAWLVVNGSDVPARFSRKTNTLKARLAPGFFAGAADIAVQVRGAGGVFSRPALLRVTRPDGPSIVKLSPSEVRAPSRGFTLTVTGRNFRGSSIVQIGGQPLTVERTGDNTLRVRVPKEIARNIGTHKVQVVDLAVPDMASNEVTLTISGPRPFAAKLPVIETLRTSRDVLVAGDGGFKLKIIGKKFRTGATVEINGLIVNPIRVNRIDGSHIRATVVRQFTEEAGKLVVVVRNPDPNSPEGLPSNQKELEVFAPDISAFDPGELLAGLPTARFNLRGTNFRKASRVFISDPSDASGQAFVALGRRRVRFRSPTRILVNFGEGQTQLLAQPGAVKLKVANPNKGEGVLSAERELKIVGPEITEAVVTGYKRDASRRKIVLLGKFFRKRAMVEFVKDGTTYGSPRTPSSVSGDRISLIVRAKKLPPGDFEVRVVNPGSVPSGRVAPRREDGTAAPEQ
ncbi:MAG TPA: IPT/TIG domain-containing protein [Blastocatellia bacterium]|nr:IPT/TIG domain-containing protein [Blastocatellia bacterium]